MLARGLTERVRRAGVHQIRGFGAADMKAAAEGRHVEAHRLHQSEFVLDAHAAGGVISTAEEVETWIRALVSGKVFNADFHKQWLAESVQAEDPEESRRAKVRVRHLI